MRFTGYSFGSVRVDCVPCDHDLIIDRGKIRKRNKAASGKFRDAYRHTRQVIGTGADGALPVMTQVGDEARRQVDHAVLPTAHTIGMLSQASKDTSAVLHLTAEGGPG